MYSSCCSFSNFRLQSKSEKHNEQYLDQNEADIFNWYSTTKITRTIKPKLKRPVISRTPSKNYFRRLTRRLSRSLSL